MPYLAMRRLHNTLGKKVSRYLSYKKAKKRFNEINKGMMMFEARYMRSKMSQV
jgi:pyoverdine/dityrosine biosynthesis protein Dit1